MTTRNAGKWTPLAAAIALATGTTCMAVPTTTITVTDGGDAGTGSTCTLRQAIQTANGSASGTCTAGAGFQSIVFASGLANSTITLTQGQLTVSQNSTSITGSGQTIDAGGASGVISIGASNVSLSNLTFTGGDAYRGGGVYAAGSAFLKLSNCHITGNTATLRGGGVAAVSGASVTISNCLIADNQAPGGSVVDDGGGVYAYSSSVSFVHSTIASNSAFEGGGVWAGHSTLTFTDSTISGNTATFNFGGVFDIYSSNVTLTNTTVYGNSAPHFGGGVFVPHSIATLINSTVSNNSASYSPGVGGQVTGGDPTNTITLYNTILANNAGDGDCYDGYHTTTIVAKNSLIADGSCGITNGVNGNITGADPQLGPLANNGGATTTMSLAAASPAIGAGNVGLAALGGAPLQYDQRGFGFPRTTAGAVDMGAFQHSLSGRIFTFGFEAEP